MRDCEGEHSRKRRECRRLARQAEVKRTSADVGRLTPAFGEFLRSGLRPLSCNYCSAMAAPITTRLIV